MDARCMSHLGPAGSKAVGMRVNVLLKDGRGTVLKNVLWGRMCLFSLAIGCILLPVQADRAHAATYFGGWDLSRGEIISWDNPDTQLVQDLLKSFYPDLLFVTTDVLTEGFLSGVDVMFFGSVSGDGIAIDPILSSDEQQALLNFVLSGGSAFVGTEWSGPGEWCYEANQSLLSPFGLHSTGLTLYMPPDNVATSTDTSHPITDGPYGMITEIVMAGAGYYDALGPYAHTLAVDGLDRSVLAVIERDAMSPGSGPVIFMSDLNAIEEEFLLTTTNGLAMLNGVDFLLVPEPTTALLLAAGLAGLAIRKHRA